MPPSGRFLLDTNIIIAVFAGEPAVLAAIRAASATFVPAVALGELYYGAQKSGRPEENVRRITALAAAVAVLPCDAETAVVYGRLKMRLKAQGTPIPENDLWIAALAGQHRLTLVTRDAHFNAVPDLTLEGWS